MKRLLAMLMILIVCRSLQASYTYEFSCCQLAPDYLERVTALTGQQPIAVYIGVIVAQWSERGNYKRGIGGMMYIIDFADHHAAIAAAQALRLRAAARGELAHKGMLANRCCYYLVGPSSAGCLMRNGARITYCRAATAILAAKGVAQARLATSNWKPRALLTFLLLLILILCYWRLKHK